jgi:hypothetical protein
MLLRDLSTRRVTLMEPVVASPGRADYFREYDQIRAADPRRKQQIREAMARYRKSRRVGR